MWIIHTKDYVPACTSNLCGFAFNTHDRTSALMESCERLEINVQRYIAEASFDFRTFGLFSWMTTNTNLVEGLYKVKFLHIELV